MPIKPWIHPVHAVVIGWRGARANLFSAFPKNFGTKNPAGDSLESPGGLPNLLSCPSFGLAEACPSPHWTAKGGAYSQETRRRLAIFSAPF